MSALRAWLRPTGPRAWLPWVLLAAVLAALVPAWAGPAETTDATLAVARGVTAAGAALALAAGRPSLAVAAVAGAAGYTSAVAALHGWPVLGAMSAGVGMAVLLSLVLGVLGARLEAAAFAALTLVAALAGGALVAAVPDVFGGSAGLSAVPPVELPLPGGDRLSFGAAGMLHVGLAACGLAVLVAGWRLGSLGGARRRAVGGDVQRAAAAGLRPLRVRLGALAVSGLLAGLGGVLAVHAGGVASPSAFSADAAVVPLLAALLAGRGGPAAAALTGAVVAVLGLWALPALGWTGPPSADALATGVLAAVALLALPVLLRRGRPRATERVLPTPPLDAPWPELRPRGGPAGLRVAGLAVVPEPGAEALARLDLDVAPGAVHGLVGHNGAGKSTALRLLAGAGAGRVLLPQAGGGWPGTTVEETLRLAARAGARAGGGRLSAGDDRAVASAWLSRLGLVDVAGVDCAALSHGVRRRVELARVLLLRPAVLLCDEPLAGLGDADRALVLAALRAAAAQGVTLLVAEHDHASLARLAGEVTELRPLDRGGLGGHEPEVAPA